MIFRENQLSLEEDNLQSKRMKLKMDEQRQSQEMEIKNKELEKKQEIVEAKEAEVASAKESLRRLQFKVNEKNAILEICLKMNNQTERISVNFSDLSCSSTNLAGILIGLKKVFTHLD